MLSQYGLIVTAFIALSLTGCEEWDSSQQINQPVEDNVPSSTLPTPTPSQQLETKTQILYVDSEQGADTANTGKTQASPLRTITYALQQAPQNTTITIQLAPGQYTVEKGETFPIELKPGVTLRGNEQNRGEGVVVRGGGLYNSRTWAGQSVTVLAAKDTKILGLTITNPKTRGTGVWVESTNPLVRNNTFINSNRDGVFVSGKGIPLIENNLFANNQGNGISVTREAKGEIRSNIIEQTGYGISIGQTTAPLVIDNQIRENLDGLVISEAARPILRGNMIANNRRDGLVATSESQPDLGTVSDPGNNIFQSNGRYDVHNFTGEKLLAIGNQLKGDRVAGLVVLKPSSTNNRTATY